MVTGNRTSCRPVLSAVILVTTQLGLLPRGLTSLLITRMVTDITCNCKKKLDNSHDGDIVSIPLSSYLEYLYKHWHINSKKKTYLTLISSSNYKVNSRKPSHMQG